MNRLAATNFRDQALSTSMFILNTNCKDLFTERNIHDNNAYKNLANFKNSRTQIKVGLLYMTSTPLVNYT